MIGLVSRPGTVWRNPAEPGAHGGPFDNDDQQALASGHVDTVCRITSRSQTWAASAWARTCQAKAIEKPGTSSGTGSATSGPAQRRARRAGTVALMSDERLTLAAYVGQSFARSSSTLHSVCVRLPWEAVVRKNLFVIALLAFASTGHAGPREDALRVVEQWSKAFADADVDGITGLYSSNALFYGTLDKSLTTQPADIRKYFERALFSGRPRTAVLREHSVSVLSDEVVVIAGLDTVTGTRDGQVVSAPGRVSFVIQKQPAGWKIVHFHRSPVPN